MKYSNVLSVFGVVIAEGSGDPTGCLNDSWELDGDGVCQPKAEFFTLSCNADGMTIDMDQSVVPDALDISLLGDCAGTLDNDTGSWSFSTALDACSTSLRTAEDGTLRFGNTLRANAFNSNSMIFTTNSVLINVECSYAQIYNDIEIETSVLGSNYTSDVDETTGLFSFNLELYNDAALTDKADANDEQTIGEPLYFKLSQEHPVTGVVFTIDNCMVKDDNLNAEYAVIDNRCPDTFLNAAVTPNYSNSDSTMDYIAFTYPAFQFIQSADDQSAVTLRVVCSTVVCDSSDSSSVCAQGCSPGRRRRAIDASEKRYNVAFDVTVKPNY